MLSDLEKSLFSQGYQAIVGLDEVGIGPLAGPVVAACCHIPPKTPLKDIDDSKKLTPIQRKLFFEKIKKNPAIVFGIGIIDVDEIDQINILNASLKAMELAFNECTTKMQHSIGLPERLREGLPDYALLDGKHAPRLQIPYQKIIKGDSLITCIKAASIIAKLVRDDLMDEYHKLYPEYGFCDHKGYGTKKHLSAIKQHGPSPIHRKSFGPVKQNQNLTALFSKV